MSENREPRISHLTKPRTRTLISSYRPFLESLTRSALTAYYRAHVVNWPSFLTISCLFPRSSLSSITPGSGSLICQIKKKILPFFRSKTAPKHAPADPSWSAIEAKSADFYPKTEFLLSFLLFRLLFLQLTIHHAVPSIAFSSRAPMKAHWFVLVFTFPFFRLKNGKLTLRLSRIKKSETQNCISRPDKSNSSRASVRFDAQKMVNFNFHQSFLKNRTSNVLT